MTCAVYINQINYQDQQQNSTYSILEQGHNMSLAASATKTKMF
jgi:hypothetical protein